MTTPSTPAPTRPSAPEKHRRFWRACGIAVLILYLAACTLVLTARYVLLPYIETSKPFIEKTLGNALERTVTIGSLEAHWYRLNPYFVLKNIEVSGSNSAPPLRIRQIVGVVSYRSLLYFSPVFSRLDIAEPELFIEQAAPDSLTVNGIAVPLRAGNDTSSDAGALAAFLHQRLIVVQKGTITYRNPKIRESDLVFAELNMALRNGPVFKQYALEATLPAPLGQKITLQSRMRPTLGHLPSNIKEWEGEVYGRADSINLAPIANLINLPNALLEGAVNAEVWAQLKDGTIASARVAGAAGDLQFRLAENAKPLRFKSVKGLISAQKDGNTFSFKASPFSYDLPGAEPVENITLGARLTFDSSGALTGGTLGASHIELSNLAGILPALPLEEAQKKLLSERKLSGLIQNAELSWNGNPPRPDSIEAKAEFSDLAVRGQLYKENQMWLPGFEHITGTLDMTPAGGKVHLRSPHSKLAFPGIFPVEYLEFDTLNADLHWEQGTHLTVTLDSLSAENKDAALTLSGFYRLDDSPLGYINLTGGISRGQVPAAWKYVPLIAGEETIDWLKRGLLAGSASNGKLVLRGPLHEFAWEENAEHDFSVTFDFRDGEIDVYPTEKIKKDGSWVKGADWPVFKNVAGHGAFIKDSMTITATEGIYQKAHLKKAIVRIPAFSADSVLLTVDAGANGPVESFLDYVNHSVISTYTAGIFSKAQASGEGNLDLALKLVLSGPGDNAVNGSFTTRNGTINFNQYLIPDMTDVNGTVNFSTNGIYAKELSAKVFDGTVKGSINTAENGDITVKAAGSFPMKGLPQVLPKGLVISSKIPNYLTGKAPFDLSVLIHQAEISLDLKSSLAGVQSRLPAPLTKESNEDMPLFLKVKTHGPTLSVDLKHEGRLQANVELKNDRLTRAAFGIPRAPDLPKNGLSILIQTPRLNLDQWLSVKDSLLPKSKETTAEITVPHFELVQVDVGELLLNQFNQENLKLSATQSPSGWVAHVESNLLDGEMEWRRAQAKTQPTLIAHFQKLYIPKSVEDAAEESKPVDIAGGWPAIDATVENLTYGAIRIGKVELNAFNTPSVHGHLWQIKKFNVTNKDSRLLSSGSWLKKPDGSNRTTILLDNNITNLGALLERFGMHRIIKSGHGTLKGELAWDGTPIGFNADSVDGNLTLLLNKGEILKIEPGAGAKLLSLLTLQSLTRYLTLDFRDFYSKGFTFDTIRGSASMTNGLMNVKDLTMVGSSASVIINGTISIPKEEQNLTILVLPDINATGASVALAIANPVVGIGSFIAQMLFKDPLSKLFSFEYKVTGTWSDPTVKKVETQTSEKAAIAAESAGTKIENIFDSLEKDVTKHF